MKYSLDTLSNLSDIDLYDYLSEVSRYSYTKQELRDLVKQKQLPVSIAVKTTVENAINIILNRLSIRIINEILEPEVKWHYIHIDKLMDRDAAYRLDFVKRYGKYLGEYELKQIIARDSNQIVKSYKEMLIELYIQDKTTKAKM